MKKLLLLVICLVIVCVGVTGLDCTTYISSPSGEHSLSEAQITNCDNANALGLEGNIGDVQIIESSGGYTISGGSVDLSSLPAGTAVQIGDGASATYEGMTINGGFIGSDGTITLTGNNNVYFENGDSVRGEALIEEDGAVLLSEGGHFESDAGDIVSNGARIENNGDIVLDGGTFFSYDDSLELSNTGTISALGIHVPKSGVLTLNEPTDEYDIFIDAGAVATLPGGVSLSSEMVLDDTNDLLIQGETLSSIREDNSASLTMTEYQEGTDISVDEKGKFIVSPAPIPGTSSRSEGSVIIENGDFHYYSEEYEETEALGEDYSRYYTNHYFYYDEEGPIFKVQGDFEFSFDDSDQLSINGIKVSIPSDSLDKSSVVNLGRYGSEGYDDLELSIDGKLDGDITINEQTIAKGTQDLEYSNYDGTASHIEEIKARKLGEGTRAFRLTVTDSDKANWVYNDYWGDMYRPGLESYMRKQTYEDGTTKVGFGGATDFNYGSTTLTIADAEDEFYYNLHPYVTGPMGRSMASYGSLNLDEEGVLTDISLDAGSIEINHGESAGLTVNRASDTHLLLTDNGREVSSIETDQGAEIEFSEERSVYMSKGPITQTTTINTNDHTVIVLDSDETEGDSTINYRNNGGNIVVGEGVQARINTKVSDPLLLVAERHWVEFSGFGDEREVKGKGPGLVLSEEETDDDGEEVVIDSRHYSITQDNSGTTVSDSDSETHTMASPTDYEYKYKSDTLGTIQQLRFHRFLEKISND